MRIKIARKFQTFRRIALHHGERAALDSLLRFMIGRELKYGGLADAPPAVKPQLGGRRLNDFYRFVISNEKLQPRSIHSDKPTVNWVVPDFGKGSGGHLNIFRFISGLEARGFQCVLTIDGPTKRRSPAACRAEIRRDYLAIDAEIILGIENAPATDYVIATGWTTAYAVRRLPDHISKFYFVQDFEPAFFPVGSEYVFAENTYRFGFKGVTAGDWLSDKLKKDYGMECTPVGFSFDRNLYGWDGKNDARRSKRVFYYTRPPTPRRGLELAMEALELACKIDPGIEVIFAGWDMSEYAIPFPHKSLGHLRLEDVRFALADSSLALIISLTNASLLPLEAMACGCPVVSNGGANVEWLLKDSGAWMTDATPEAIAEAIVSLVANPDLLEKLGEQSSEFAATTSWERNFDILASTLRASPERAA